MSAATTWRCGHPRTPWNTYNGAHDQCLTCRRESQKQATERYDAKLGRLNRTMQKGQSERRAWFRENDPAYFAERGDEPAISLESVRRDRARGMVAKLERVQGHVPPESGAQARRVTAVFAIQTTTTNREPVAV